jgi:hypothetical protein
MSDAPKQNTTTDARGLGGWGRVCPACRIGGFTASKAADGRPLYKCQRCDHTWTAGHAGGIYRGNEQRVSVT